MSVTVYQDSFFYVTTMHQVSKWTSVFQCNRLSLSSKIEIQEESNPWTWEYCAALKGQDLIMLRQNVASQNNWMFSYTNVNTSNLTAIYQSPWCNKEVETTGHDIRTVRMVVSNLLATATHPAVCSPMSVSLDSIRSNGQSVLLCSTLSSATPQYKPMQQWN